MTQTNPTQDAPQPPARNRPAPTPQPRAVVCPYCGKVSANTTKCDACSGRFDPLSRQATQNGMGPWQVRNELNPTLPGFSYDTLLNRIEQGKVTVNSVVRGPTTRQFWMLARRVPGVAHLLGFCHACQAKVDPEQYACTSCGAVFHVDRDRQHLGLGPARMLPGQGSPERIAAYSQASHAAVESPSWAWGTGGENARTEEQPAHHDDAPLHSAPPSDAFRVKRIERALVRQRMTTRLLIGVCVVLVGALFVMSVMSRDRNGPVRSPEGPGLAGADELVAPDDSVTPPVMADEPPPEEELGSLGADPGWAGVRERVMSLIERGSSESISAGVLELEALQRRGELPAEGVELLERLRTEIDSGRLRNIP